MNWILIWPKDPILLCQKLVRYLSNMALLAVSLFRLKHWLLLGKSNSLRFRELALYDVLLVDQWSLIPRILLRLPFLREVCLLYNWANKLQVIVRRCWYESNFLLIISHFLQGNFLLYFGIYVFGVLLLFNLALLNLWIVQVINVIYWVIWVSRSNDRNWTWDTLDIVLLFCRCHSFWVCNTNLFWQFWFFVGFEILLLYSLKIGLWIEYG